MKIPGTGNKLNGNSQIRGQDLTANEHRLSVIAIEATVIVRGHLTSGP